MSRAVAFSILYIKNTNKAVSIVVVSSLVILYIKNTNNAVYLLNL